VSEAAILKKNVAGGVDWQRRRSDLNLRLLSSFFSIEVVIEMGAVRGGDGRVTTSNGKLGRYTSI
jgi:hypothetical protein